MYRDAKQSNRIGATVLVAPVLQTLVMEIGHMRNFTMSAMALVAAVAVLTLGWSSSAHANLIVNGDMEGPTYGHGIPTGWQTAGAALNLDSSSDVSGTGGTLSLEFVNLNGSITDLVSHDFVAIVAGETYTTNFEYKTTGGGIYGVFQTNAGNPFQGVIAAESLVWTSATPIQVVAPVGATQGRWLFYGMGAQETIYLDNVTLVPEPGSVALLGLGGLALLARRRRQVG